jgi:hypothetical protein
LASVHTAARLFPAPTGTAPTSSTPQRGGSGRRRRGTGTQGEDSDEDGSGHAWTGAVPPLDAFEGFAFELLLQDREPDEEAAALGASACVVGVWYADRVGAGAR